MRVGTTAPVWSLRRLSILMAAAAAAHWEMAFLKASLLKAWAANGWMCVRYFPVGSSVEAWGNGTFPVTMETGLRA